MAQQKQSKAMLQHDEDIRKRMEESHLILRRVLGILGMSLPFILMLWGFALSNGIQASVSDYYHLRTRDAFVGTLVAMGLFLAAYRGFERRDDIAGYLAGACALGVAFFPNKPAGWQSTVHFMSAAGLFLILSFFSIVLFTKTEPSKDVMWYQRIGAVFGLGPDKSRYDIRREKRWRNLVFVLCGFFMLGFMILLATLNMFYHELGSTTVVYWIETFMLLFFGISWMVKGEWLGLQNKDE